MADSGRVGIRRRRSLAAVLVVACVVAAGGVLTACGEEEGSRGEPAALDTVLLGKIKRLDTQQYRAVKGIFDAGDELERNDNTGLSPDIILQPLADACENFSEDDPLLAPVRTQCVELVGFQTALAEAIPCAGAEECVGFYEDARTSLQAFVRASRLSDRAVDATRLPRACKRALKSSKAEYAESARYDRTLAALQTATRTDSTDDDAIAGRRLIRLFNAEPAGSSQGLRSVRRACRRR